MVLSKGQKIILIAVAVFIVIASAFLGYQLYRSTQSKMNDAIEPVMGGYALSFADPYDAETSKDFIEEYWNPVKDKSSFHKKFVKQLQTQVIDLSFQNAGLDSDDQIENEFGETVTNAHGVIVEMMPFLKRVNYEDEPLKECLKITTYVWRKTCAPTCRMEWRKMAPNPSRTGTEHRRKAAERAG